MNRLSFYQRAFAAASTAIVVFVPALARAALVSVTAQNSSVSASASFLPPYPFDSQSVSTLDIGPFSTSVSAHVDAFTTAASAGADNSSTFEIFPSGAQFDVSIGGSTSGQAGGGEMGSVSATGTGFTDFTFVLSAPATFDISMAAIGNPGEFPLPNSGSASLSNAGGTIALVNISGSSILPVIDTLPAGTYHLQVFVVSRDRWALPNTGLPSTNNGPVSAIAHLTIGVVPEPSSYTLLGVGAFGLLVVRRRLARFAAHGMSRTAGTDWDGLSK